MLTLIYTVKCDDIGIGNMEIINPNMSFYQLNRRCYEHERIVYDKSEIMSLDYVSMFILF